MKCKKCNAEIPEGAKFCTSCGTKVELAEKLICPACGAELPNGTKFCVMCGCNLNGKADNHKECTVEKDEVINDNEVSHQEEVQAKTVDLVEEAPSPKEESLPKEEPVQKQEETKPVKEQIAEIVHKYISRIGKDCEYYTSNLFDGPKGEKVLKNLLSKFGSDLKQSDILGFIDTTIMNSGKAGLLFTEEAVYEKSFGSPLRIPYDKITTFHMEKTELVFDNVERFGKEFDSDSDVSFTDEFYRTDLIGNCLTEIIGVIRK